MTEPLLNLVNAELLPAIAPLGFRVVESSVADVFDNASVVVQALDVRVEVVRDRGIVMFKIGPVTEPGASYDPGLLLNYLGLSSIDGYGGPDAGSVLRGVGAFTKSMFNELRTMFGPQHLAQTKKDLNALAEERAARLFGG